MSRTDAASASERLLMEYTADGRLTSLRRSRYLPAGAPEATSRGATDISVAAAAPHLDLVIAHLTAHVEVAGRLSGAADRLHISSEEALAALEALADTTPAGAADPPSTLTVEEEQVLREAGSLQHALPPLGRRASSRTVTQQLALVADGLNVKQAAATLGVSQGRIRQRLGARSLFGVPDSAGWRLPRFQFTAEGSLLRGLDQVLPALPQDVHPVVVVSFLHRPNEDLLVEGEPTSPATWLAGGGAVDTVVRLAAALHDLT